MSKSWYQQQVDEIMDHFNFANMLRCMEFLEWRWGFKRKGEEADRIPTESELRCRARQLLDDNEGKEETWMDTGGFRAGVHKGRPYLLFIVEEWSSDRDEPAREKELTP